MIPTMVIFSYHLTYAWLLFYFFSCRSKRNIVCVRLMFKFPYLFSFKPPVQQQAKTNPVPQALPSITPDHPEMTYLPSTTIHEVKLTQQPSTRFLTGPLPRGKKITKHNRSRFKSDPSSEKGGKVLCTCSFPPSQKP